MPQRHQPAHEMGARLATLGPDGPASPRSPEIGASRPTLTLTCAALQHHRLVPPTGAGRRALLVITALHRRAVLYHPVQPGRSVGWTSCTSGAAVWTFTTTASSPACSPPVAPAGP